MRVREDYENVAWRRFVRWVNGETLESGPKEITSRDVIKRDDEVKKQREEQSKLRRIKTQFFVDTHIARWYPIFYKVFSVLLAEPPLLVEELETLPLPV